MTATEIEQALPRPQVVREAIATNLRERRLLELVLKASEFDATELRPRREKETQCVSH